MSDCKQRRDDSALGWVVAHWEIVISILGLVYIASIAFANQSDMRSQLCSEVAKNAEQDIQIAQFRKDVQYIKEGIVDIKERLPR